MSRFVTTDTTRIDLGDGDWAVIRKELGYGDRTSIQEKLMSNLTPEQMMELDRLAQQENAAAAQGVDSGPKAPSAAEKELAEVRFNHREANIETLLRAIVEWGGPGFMVNGQVVPITAEWITVLDGTAEQILKELRRVMVTKTEDFTLPPSQPTNTALPEADPLASVSTT